MRRKRKSEKAVQRIHEKAVILEKPEQQQIHRDGDDHNAALPPGDTVHKHPEAPVHQNRQDHQDHINRLSPRVKQQGEQEKNDIFQSFSRKQVIQKETCREEKEDENRAAEYHVYLSIILRISRAASPADLPAQYRT